MLHSTHGIGGTRNIVVYACRNTNRLVCENAGNCYKDTDHDKGCVDEFTLIGDGSDGRWRFLMLSLFQNRDIMTSVHHGFNVDNDYNIRFRTV